MAVLPDAQRKAARSLFVYGPGATHEIDLSKMDLRAAIDATDEWINDNSASFNTALPEPAKSNLTAAQKARLLMVVIQKRWEVV